MKRIGLAVIFLSIVHLVLAEPASEEETVVAVVQKLFDAMASQDMEAARSVLVPEGHVVRVAEDGSLRQISNEAFVTGLGQATEKLLERMWEPKVMVHERVAMVWAPYDFHHNGELSHCGVDVFSLVKTEQGWKIAGTVYTAEQACEPSPLGPPR